MRILLVLAMVSTACGGGKTDKGDKVDDRLGGDMAAGACAQLTKCCDAVPKDDTTSSSVKRACAQERSQDLLCWTYLGDVHDSASASTLPEACKAKQ